MRTAARGSLRVAFSLIESLFTLGILVIVSGGVFTLLYSNDFGVLAAPDQSDAMADTQAVLRRMSDDFHSGSGFAWPSNPVYGIGVEVIFPSGAAVEYYQDGTNLKRLETATGTITSVLTGVDTWRGLLMKYYDVNMNALWAPMTDAKYAQAAAIDVTLLVNLPHKAFGQVTRSTRIVLRNKPG